MATVEPRINIALDGNTISILKEIAQNTKKSVSAICAEFIRRQIELDEDAYDIKLIENLGEIDINNAVKAEEVRRILDDLPD